MKTLKYEFKLELTVCYKLDKFKFNLNLTKNQEILHIHFVNTRYRYLFNEESAEDKRTE